MKILHCQQPITVKLLTSHILQWYWEKSVKKIKRFNLPIITTSLKRRTKLTIQVMKSLSEFPLILEKRLQNAIDKVIKNINMSFNLKTKQANFLTIPLALKLANLLWTGPTPRRIRGEATRKKAAVALVMCAYTGSRWIDVHRLQWQDLKKSKTSTMLFITAELRLSKNNLCNEVPQRLSWARAFNDESPDNPVTWIQRLWIYQGRPKKGYMFPPPRATTPMENWGDSTLKQVRKVAQFTLLLPPTELPSKHSPRVTMAVTLFNMGISEHRLNRFMNWKTSRMQERYINTRDSRLPGAPAHQLASISGASLGRIQKHLM